MGSRSVASVLNAAGARLRYSMNTLSSAKLAGKFMEVLQDEAASVNAEKAIYCPWHQQDEIRNFQHHEKLFGFPFSQDSCPGQAESVVGLFKALLSRSRAPTFGWRSSLGSVAHEHNVGNLSPQYVTYLICFLQGA
jgi:hypothetical protein